MFVIIAYLMFCVIDLKLKYMIMKNSFSKSVYSFIQILSFGLMIFFSATIITAQTVCHAVFQTISQDGKFIYFCSNMETENYKIYRSDIDGNNIVRLTYSDVNDLYPDASPDVKWIVFQRGDYNAYSEIYRMNIDGSNLMKLTDNSVYDGKPRFSP